MIIPAFVFLQMSINMTLKVTVTNSASCVAECIKKRSTQSDRLEQEKKIEAEAAWKTESSTETLASQARLHLNSLFSYSYEFVARNLKSTSSTSVKLPLNRKTLFGFLDFPKI